MPRIEWNDSLKLGVARLDKQHEKLVGLMNDLFDACTRGRGADVVEEAIFEAHDYIDYHFTSEQRLMEEYDYPELGEHVDGHDDYIVQAADDFAVLREGAGDAASEVLERLTGWWVEHIGGPDRRLADFLRAQGLK